MEFDNSQSGGCAPMATLQAAGKGRVIAPQKRRVCHRSTACAMNQISGFRRLSLINASFVRLLVISSIGRKRDVQSIKLHCYQI